MSAQPTRPKTSAAPAVDDGWILLTRAELIDLTGSKQPARQRKWLEDRSWPYADALVDRGASAQMEAKLIFEALVGEPKYTKTPLYVELRIDGKSIFRIVADEGAGQFPSAQWATNIGTRQLRGLAKLASSLERYAPIQPFKS